MSHPAFRLRSICRHITARRLNLVAAEQVTRLLEVQALVLDLADRAASFFSFPAPTESSNRASLAYTDRPH